MKSKSGQIVRRYATAFFESALESGALEEIAPQARSLHTVIGESMGELFDNPRIDEERKGEILEELVKHLRLHPILAGLLRVCYGNRRMGIIAPVLEEFLVRSDEHRGIVRVELISARVMGGSEIQEFQSVLSEALKRKVVLASSVEPELKAGYLVKIGNTVIDASLRTRLMNLKESLSQGV